MRNKEFIDLSDAYKQICEHVDVRSENDFQEEVDIYDQVLEYLLSEGYSEEESNQIMAEIINEAGLGSLVKGAKALAGFIAKRAQTPARTAAIDSLITGTALNPVSSAKIAKNIAKSAPDPAPIVRTVKATPVRTAPKGANKITTNVWNEPTAPRSRINPSKPSGPKVSSSKALPGTPSRPALPSAGKTSASVKAPKPTFKPEALPKATKSAEPAGALVSTRAPKPTFKPEALPKATKSAEPAGALVSTRAPKPTFKPEALPKATKSAEPAGALVSTRAPKPTFKPEALPKTPKTSQPAGALVSTRAPKPTFKPEALPKDPKVAQPAGALVRTKAPKPTAKPSGGSAGIPKSPKGLKRLGASIAGAAALGVASDMESPKSTAPGTPDKAPKFPTTAKEVKKGQTYYDPNTRVGTSQRFAQRKKVGPAKIGSTFDSAFNYYRKSGAKEFTYAGKKYTTQLAKEQFVCNYLLDEGFASDEKSAEAIISVMSEQWIQNIIEQEV